MQVYAGGINVALGKPLRVKDVADKPGPTRWAPEFVVDGYSSRYRLIKTPAYLELIGRQGRLVKEQTMLRARRERKVRQVITPLRVGGGGLRGVALLGWRRMMVRRKAVRRRDQVRLRQQIALDLHDDVGSNLGGIVLLREMGIRHRRLDEESRNDFKAIKETLNNVGRHAAAARVEVRITIRPTHLAFAVRDDGVGFDPQAVAESGHGLRNLQRRAERLKGTYRLESTPGHGTISSFKASLKS